MLAHPNPKCTWSKTKKAGNREREDWAPKSVQNIRID